MQFDASAIMRINLILCSSCNAFNICFTIHNAISGLGRFFLKASIVT